MYFDSLMEKEGPTRPDFDFIFQLNQIMKYIFSSLTYEIHEYQQLSLIFW